MKKIISLLLLLVFGFCLVPAVYAEEEEIPTEGVHYFLTYPNNESVISDDYADVSKEILLYTGKTNANGEVILKNWKEQGKIRVVQKVPAGYQTDLDNLSVDLSKGNAEFIDYKQIVNPHTGQSVLFLVLIGAVLAGTYFTVRSPKKKALMMIPVVAIAAVSLHVFADSDFTIVVKDKQGNRLVNVDIEVYGTPTTVEAAPVVVFKANGGKFLDGTEEMMMKLPHNDCSIDEFMSALTDEENEYFFGNADGAVREGYERLDWDFPENGLLSDGMEINLLWEEATVSKKVIKINGNGGAYPFNGSQLNEIFVYDGDTFRAYNFIYEGKHVIGLDDNPECSNYSGETIKFKAVSNDTDELYVCWEDGVEEAR